MKILIGFAVAMQLALTAASPALAYMFTPPDTRALLRGAVTLTGPDGPFRCKAHFVVRTASASSGKHDAKITSATVIGPSPCDTVIFFPDYFLRATGLNKGNAGIVYAIPGVGNICEQLLTFTVNAEGDFTFPPGTCFSGVLRTTPVVTIVP